MHRKNKLTRYNWADRVFLTVDFIVLFIFFLLIAYPLLFIISASFDSANSTLSASLIPRQFSLEGYRAVFEYEYIWIGYRNSLIYTVLYVVISLTVTICCAYPLSRDDFKGRGIIMVMCLITMYFSGGLIPSYLIINSIGLNNTLWAVVLPGALSVFNMIVIRTYFRTQIPSELFESAQLDGCGNIYYLLRIVLPLSVPILAVIALFNAVGMWNSYFSSMIYLQDRNKFPLQLILREILITNTLDPTTLIGNEGLLGTLMERKNLMKYSVIVVASLPVMIAYPFVQKYFVKGIMIGAIKG